MASSLSCGIPTQKTTVQKRSGENYDARIGETWRIHFRPAIAEKVASLFRKQVAVTGTGKYYRIATPKLEATDIAHDEERDYETAFDELFGSDRHIYGNDFEKALKDMQGED